MNFLEHIRPKVLARVEASKPQDPLRSQGITASPEREHEHDCREECGRGRVERQVRDPSRENRNPLESKTTPRSLRTALRGRREISVIAEFKRRSPSAGELSTARISEQIKAYEHGGAAALSILTEPEHFAGDLADIAEASRRTTLPILMKDFVLDPRQLEAGRAAGASAALLICAFLQKAELKLLLSACRDLGLESLVECRDAPEVELSIELGAEIIGVNNRDLKTLEVRLDRAPSLLGMIPKDLVAVSESGFRSAPDLRTVQGLADAVLIGSSLMRSSDPARHLESLRRS